MTIQALAWAIDQSLPGTAKLVLAAMANHADHTTGFVHFDASTIAAEASLPERSLWRYLGALERNNYLAKTTRKLAGQELRDYWLALDRDPSIGWAWIPEDGEKPEAVEASERPSAPMGSSAPRTFRRAEQDQARAAASAPPADAPPGIPVLEGSRAFDDWLRWHRDRRKVAPFVRTIQTADGQMRRGFYMPTLFPPAEDIPA